MRIAFLRLLVQPYVVVQRQLKPVPAAAHVSDTEEPDAKFHSPVLHRAFLIPPDAKAARIR